MNPDKSLAATPSEELPWRAFLYVSEELTPEETQEFEERLLSDQAAREAVAHAMKMSEGLWMASAMDSLNGRPAAHSAPALESAVVSQSTRERSRSVMWLVSTVVAASLAFCVGWWFAQHRNDSHLTLSQDVAQSPSQESPKGEPATETDVEGAEQLLEIWTASESLLAELESIPTGDFSSIDVPTRDTSDSEEESFSWMLAAVSVPANTVPPAEPAVMEN